MDLRTEGGAGEYGAGVTNYGGADNHVDVKGYWNCKAGHDTS